MRQRGPLAIGMEIAWQAFFYLIPCMFDLGAFAEWMAIHWFGGDFKMMIIGSIAAVLNIGWFLPNFFYMILYLIQHPFFEQYRCQDWVWNQAPNPRRTKYMEVLKSTIVTFLINQVILTCTIMWLGMTAMSHTDDQEHIREFIRQTPPLYEGFGKIVLGLLAFETCFYWTHVWLHTPMGYKYHKDHHAYYTPMSLSGQWGSLLDGLVSLPIPAFAPVFILNFHPTTLWFYAFIQTSHSSYDHCGYDFPFNPFQLIPFGSHGAAHNFHHSHNVDNFGLYFRFWDNIMGTNQHWNRYCAKRDALLDKLNQGLNAEDDDYIIKNGIMLLKCVAEQNDIKDGTDNLEFTYKHIGKNIDEKTGELVTSTASTTAAAASATATTATAASSTVQIDNNNNNNQKEPIKQQQLQQPLVTEEQPVCDKQILHNTTSNRSVAAVVIE